MFKIYFTSILFYLVALNSLMASELNLKHRQGSGVGYKRQYSTVDLYYAFENASWQPFIDLRYLILNKSKQGANLGAGLGYQFSQANRVSLYSYFDLTESRTGHLFNQIMGGAAYTHPLFFSGKDWGEIACYLNGYFPLKSFEKNIEAPSFSRFRGHELLIKQKNRAALTGSNFELGYLSNTWNHWNLYIAGSAYYFKRSALHAFGGLGKLRVTYNDLLSFEGMISGDRLFGTDVSGTISFRIPLGKKEMQAVKKRKYCPHKLRPIERFEPIVLKKDCRELVAKDDSGAPLHFIFVNNLSGSDGTFEDPFPTLSQAENTSQSGDFIYVFPGDGTTTGMDNGITLKQAQTLAGSGTALAVSTQLGSIIVPNFTSQRPQITNTGGAGVIINRNCTVSGIVVNNALSNGFSHNLLSGNTSTVTLLDCTAESCLGRGFRMRSANSSTLKVAHFNCSANSNSDRGFDIDATSSASLMATYSNCSSSSNTRSGFCITSLLASTTVAYSNCSSSFNTSVNGDGFEVIARPDSSLEVTASDCFANSNAANGFFLSAVIGSDMLTATLSNCSSSLNATGFSINGTNLSGTLNNCSATGNGLDFDIMTPAATVSSTASNSTFLDLEF